MASHSIVKGSNPPIELQLYPKESNTGANGIDLTVMTTASGYAKRADGRGSVITIPTVIFTDKAHGKVKLEFYTSTFPEVGVYEVQLQFTDANGKVYIFPSDGSSLQIKVVASVQG